MDMLRICVILASLYVESFQHGPKRLDEYISHFEPLSYDSNTVHNHHQRAKRSTVDPYVNLKFESHGRKFHLRLKRDTSTFSKDFKLQQSNGKLVDHDTSYVYDGVVWGEPGTEVYGSIINGVFAGTIHTPKGNYYIEKAEHFFSDEQPFHSVIYSEHDMDHDPHRLKRAAEQMTCGNSDSNIHKWMQEVQNSAVNEPTKKKKRDVDFEDRPVGENIYTAAYNKYRKHRKQHKRETDREKRTCTLFLQSDTMMWDYMTGSIKDKVGLGYDADRAREEITSLFATHVKGIKNIYGNTVFEHSSLKYSGFSFVVRRVKINETSDCEGQTNLLYNKFCQPNIDVSNYLNLNSLMNHDDFCLAYVFTYRDFTGGTLGLAWVGSPTRASGGICERWKEYTENSNKVSKSLNTGIVTLINYGSRVPVKVSTLTFAHEVGHNFGSPHDSGTSCSPYSGSDVNKEGNFIMFASATSGDRPNNSKFSICSKKNITQVLDAVIAQQYSKNNCFVESEEAFCGNKIVEGDEMCDCGYEGDCDDKCCFPRGNANQCELRDTAECSPTAGPCCTGQCTKVRSDEDMVCRTEDSCTQEAKCNGTSAACPTSEPKANDTACNDYTQVCINGECRWSICRLFGWEQCYLTTPKENAKDFDKGKLCFVACQNPSTKECVSTGDDVALNKPDNSKLKEELTKHNRATEGIKLPPGAPCDNFQGYCDVFQKCRGVDADGPLARLKNLLFSEETFTEIRDWIIRYWWAVLLMGIGGVIFMGIFISVCAVHTPSSNPKRAPARKLTLRPQPRNRQQGPPPGYSGPNRGGPPHGKGRGPASQAPPPYNPNTPQQYEMKGQGASGASGASGGAQRI